MSNRKVNYWVEFVKQIARDSETPYSELLKDSTVKDMWADQKEDFIREYNGTPARAVKRVKKINIQLSDDDEEDIIPLRMSQITRRKRAPKTEFSSLQESLPQERQRNYPYIKRDPERDEAFREFKEDVINMKQSISKLGLNADELADIFGELSGLEAELSGLMSRKNPRKTTSPNVFGDWFDPFYEGGRMKRRMR